MSGKETHMDFNKLLSSYLSGELRPEELAWFEEELSRDPAKHDLLAEYRKIWDTAAPEHTYDLDAEWTLLREKTPGFEAGSGTGKQVKTPSLLYYGYRIAAVLVLGLVLAFSWMYVSRTVGMEKVMAGNEAVKVLLEDGTEVIVNRNSKLRYSRKFNQQERKVYLSGEAWFDVARDTTMPFVIDAGAALVEVLGTSFNVNAYQENSTVEISVESGMVALKAKEDQQNLIVMRAGSGGSYNKAQRELKLILTPDPNTISWKTKELFFEHTALSEVCELVSKVYGVKLVLLNQELADCSITVTFRDQSLESVLSVLESTLDLQMERVGDEIRFFGEGCVD